MTSFRGAITTVVFSMIAAAAFDDDGNPETDEVTIILRWNDWPLSWTDYDLYLFDYATDELAAASANYQDGSQQPVEVISMDIPDSQTELHFYYVVVTRVEGEPVGVEMEIYLGPDSLFVPFGSLDSAIATPTSCVAEPADAESVLAVGAIHHALWETGPPEEFSSQGPTNAWAGSPGRIKPDIMGPDGVSTTGYAGSEFLGTSASAPHVAGAAALLAAEYPLLGPDELEKHLTSAALDMGTVGKDNFYGWGRLKIDPLYLAADVDGSGHVDLADVLRILQLTAGLAQDIVTAGPGGDLEGDGRVGLGEAVYVLQLLSGLRP